MADKRISRRHFIKAGSTLAGTASILQSVPMLAASTSTMDESEVVAYKYPNAGKIVIVEHPGAVLGINNVDQAAVQYMFDQGIMQLTGISTSPADALASLFPGLTTSKKIAIKPNFLNSSVPTRKELTKAVVTRLVQMLGGFPAGNITVYERHTFSSVGYTSAFFGIPIKLVYDATYPNLGYTIYCNGKNRPYSKSLHDADYLINMPVLKDHSCSNALDVTLAFKNHMGTLNPGGSLGIHCDKKAILDVMADSVMTTKQRLVILDSLYAVYNGGPGGAPQVTPNKIMLSQDPVTIDAQGKILINSYRAANGLSAKSATYITEAAAAPYTIGIADPSLMQIINVRLPVRLASFVATLHSNTVHLQWITDEEMNCAGFAIERFSEKTEQWEQIGYMKGNGTTSVKQEYHHIDALQGIDARTEILSYRLKQIDFDGKYEYSIKAEVRMRDTDRAFVLEQNYPNPFSSNTEIHVSLPAEGFLKIEIFDAKGSRVATLQNGVAPEGYRSFEWNATGLSAGLYYCRATYEAVVHEIQLVLMK